METLLVRDSLSGALKDLREASVRAMSAAVSLQNASSGAGPFRSMVESRLQVAMPVIAQCVTDISE